MRRAFLSASLAAMIAFCLSLPVAAFFDLGHMAVAEIAYRKLTPACKKRVDSLMKLNPFYKQWLDKIPADAPESEKKMMVFMEAATWADSIIYDSSYIADGKYGGNVADGPVSSKHIGYGDKRMHKYWHFINQPFSCDGTQLPPVPDENIETAIDRFRKLLSSDSPDELKSYALTWLVHLAGDVHQPLHCTTRVSRSEPRGDKGGNDVKVVWSKGETRLHAVWDGIIGDDRRVEAARSYAEWLPEATGCKTADLDTKDWVKESFKLARKKVYRPPVKAGDGPFRLTRRYENTARSILDKRVELAGARLARVLNGELK